MRRFLSGCWIDLCNGLKATVVKVQDGGESAVMYSGSLDGEMIKPRCEPVNCDSIGRRQTTLEVTPGGWRCEISCSEWSV